MKSKQRVRDDVLERKCHRCGEWLWIEEFVKSKQCAGGRRPVCKACRCEQKREWRLAKIDLYKATERGRRKRLYWSNPERSRRIGRISRAKYLTKSRARGLPRHNERDEFGRFRKVAA